jgi:phage baseplate assembly protein V
MGTFIPGLYGNAGAPPDNRDHVEVWRFDDGGSLVYDWEALTYTITLPSGTVTIKVGSTVVVVTDNAVTAKVSGTEVALTPSSATVKSAAIKLVGAVAIDGPLHVTQNITGDASIIDATGNSNHHTH